MSQQAQLPTPENAIQTLFGGLHNQVFFQKLAAAGHPHNNDPQRIEAMIDLAGKLEAAEYEAASYGGVKQASDPYVAANQALDPVLNARGLTGGIKAAAERSLDEQVMRIMQNADIYDAALAVKAAEAEQYKQALQLA